MHVYIPEGLDLDFLPKQSIPAAQWFVASVYMQKTMRKLSKDSFVPMQSVILRRWMGNKYKKLLSDLATKGIVECDNVKVIGRKSLGYRLTSHYRSQTHRRIVLSGHVMNKRLVAWKEEQECHWSNIHQKLYKWLTQVELTCSPRRCPNQSLSITRIHDQDFFFKVDPYGRVHTNLTNLKGSLRKYLRVHDQPLVEIDLSNSQPLMLCVLANNLIRNNYKLESINSYLNFQTPKKQPNKHPPSHSPLCVPFLGTAKNTPDLEEYQTLCEQGLLYEHLRQLTNTPGTEIKRLKKRVISRCLYCKNRDQDNDLFKTFERRFPTLGKVIRTVKREQGYRQLPRLLQRIEADLVIHRVCARLAYDYPEIPLYTIHDSIMTTAPNVDTVARVLKEECLTLGIAASLKIK
jgi:hypothetical protein